MLFGRGGDSGRLGLSRRLLVATAIVGTMAGGAYAQNAPANQPAQTNAPTGQQPPAGGTQNTGQGATQTAAPGETQPSGIAAIIEANLAQPGQICPACTPLVMADPNAAAEIIAAAKRGPSAFEKGHFANRK